MFSFPNISSIIPVKLEKYTPFKKSLPDVICVCMEYNYPSSQDCGRKGDISSYALDTSSTNFHLTEAEECLIKIPPFYCNKS